MSCESSCGPLVVTLLTGVPGVPGAEGPQGPQGPPGSLTSVTGDLSLTAGESGAIATVVGIQGNPVSETSPTANQILAYTGTQYQPTTFSAGSY